MQLIQVAKPLRLQAFGVVVSAILTVIQFPLLDFCKSSEVPSLFKLIAKSLFSIVAGFATVYSFRGIWYLLDAYYIPGKSFDGVKEGQKTGGNGK